MIVSLVLITLIYQTQAVDQLYTLFADGSYQYYTLDICYQMFFPYERVDPETGTTQFIQSYYIHKNETAEDSDQPYFEIYFSDASCNSEAFTTDIVVGINCKECIYNITQGEIISDTFASMIFYPLEMESCGGKTKYVHNNYPDNIEGTCVNGNLGGNDLSYITKLVEQDRKLFMERKRFLGHDCSGDPLETIKEECGKCSHIQCEIDVFAQISCEYSASVSLSILFMLLICFILF